MHDKLLEIVKPQIQRLRLGSVLLDDDDDVDMGAMISPRSFSRLEQLIDAAVAREAILHCGGRRYAHPRHPHGHYFEPTLLSNVTPDMEIAQQELFAPVFVLMSAANVDDAIRVANSTEYGLGASVFGHNAGDVARCVRGFQSGMVAINDFGAYYACSLPFGGCRGSGYGRFGGEEGLKSLCNIKAVCDETWWARLMGVRTQIPGPLRYPVDARKGWRMCQGVVELGYALGARGRLQGLWKLVGPPGAPALPRTTSNPVDGRK